MLQSTGWWILSILSLLPLVLWLFQEPIKYRFLNLSLFARGLGDVFGLCGMAMFSLVIILSARLKFYEKFFKGINDAYVAHHFFGGLALVLLLFHPLFLAYNYLVVSVSAAAGFLLPGANMAQNYGIIGLLVMIITLVITFYTKLKYQVWRFTHKFLGLAFLFAILHVFLIGADLNLNYWLKSYLFVLALLAGIAYLYRALFANFFVKVFNYTVSGIEALPDKTWEVELTRMNKALKFLAGQFAFVKFFNKNLSHEAHPFSFSSTPDKSLKIDVKELGDYTNKIGNLKVGDRATIEGPFGSFSFRNYGPKQVWIAGGVGITPFMSMLRDLSKKDDYYQIDLYYSVRDEENFIFKDEITKIAEQNKNLNVYFWVSNKEGLIGANSVTAKTKDLDERDILICGPGIMMTSLQEQFTKQGIKARKIHMEEFQLY